MTSTELVIPSTGEMISLEDAQQCAGALEEIRQLENRLRDLKRILTGALIEESTRVGGKTLHLGPYKAVINDSNSILWDVAVLERLLKAGLPQERYDELVTMEVSFKVNSSVAKQIEKSNPKYGRIIKKARTEVPRTPSVSITSERGV